MSHFLDQLADISRLGFGIGLKDRYCGDLLKHQHTVDWADQIEWVEVIPENYLGKGGRSRQVLTQLIDAGFPMASHGVNLSLGSVDPFNPEYLDGLQTLFNLIEPVWYSDHLTFSSVNGQYFNELMPLPFTQETIEIVVRKIRQLQARFRAPFLIENASYYLAFADSDGGLSEAQFLTRILEEADCGLLLDINNVYVNARNHDYDPIAFLNEIPLERVVEIHIAGHLETPDLIIDTHGEPIRDEVFALLSHVYPRCPNIKGVLLERDSNLPSFEVLLAELHEVRASAFASMALEV